MVNPATRLVERMGAPFVTIPAENATAAISRIALKAQEQLVDVRVTV